MYVCMYVFLLPVEGCSNLESVVSMQSSAQEVTMLLRLIAAAKDSWGQVSSVIVK